MQEGLATNPSEHTDYVSDLRQSRRLDGGGAAQSRMALRAVIARSSCHKHLGCQSVPCPSSVPATLPSPSLSEDSKAIAVLPHFGADHSLRSGFRVHNYHSHAPMIFPEPSNSGSLPGKAGGFPVHLRMPGRFPLRVWAARLRMTRFISHRRKTL
jgi:hypothetical protein